MPGSIAAAAGRSKGRVTQIAQGNFTDMSIGGDGPDWQVNLSPDVLGRGSKLNAHLTLHELGHVVDGVLGTDPWRERLFRGPLALAPLARVLAHAAGLEQSLRPLE